MERHGKARLGRKTKDLIKVLKHKDIAIIDHEDLDFMGASGLVEVGVSGVINAACSITGRYPNLGPKLLLEHHIPLVDNVGPEVFTQINDGDMVHLRNGEIYCNNQLVTLGRNLSLADVIKSMEEAKPNLDYEVAKFVDNTLEYAAKEKKIFLEDLSLPSIKTTIAHRHAVVVVRGLGYRDDLEAISAYIEEMNPVLIGVDGGADGLLEFGHKPDIIIGDMDSVSDKALCCGAEILVHAYSDGRCPGKKRLEMLKIEHKLFPAPGTSEDIALLLAYESGAQLIVAVGTHSNLIDFLEKGRQGMASTFLVRMKMGSHLVDAKGVSQLYNSCSGTFPLPLIIAAVVPIIVFITLASPWRHLARLLWLQARLFVGGF